MTRLAIFAVASLPIVWVSKRSLPHPKSHGFPRFFAFEAILGLIVLNASRWFAHPLGMRQLASWLFLSISLLFVLWGFMLLRRRGGFELSEEISPTAGREDTACLVTTGIYRYIRHPLYSSVLFLAWGAVLKSVTVTTLILGAAATFALAATAKFEEVENVARFGQGYREYMRGTRRFVPFLL